MSQRQSMRITVGLSALCLLTACTASHQASAGGQTAPQSADTITVSSDQCAAAWRHASPGLQTFQIHSTAPGAIDVSLINPQTGSVYSEVEAIGPDTIRAMPVDLGSGSYAFQCDSSAGPPLTGPTVVVRGHVTSGTGVAPPDVSMALAAVGSDRTYITNGLATVARQTSVLAADIQAGDLTAARSAWLAAHLSWEKLGSAYGMFGDYDGELDGTPDSDGLAKGAADPGFTGFYRIEYGLWHGQSAAQLTGPAQQLTRGVAQLRSSYQGMALYPAAALSDLALRTHEILEHSVRFQLSGADDFGSGTTLATVNANIDATRAQLAMLKPLLQSSYPGLPSVYTWLDRFQRLIGSAHHGTTWTPASALSTARREQLNAAGAECVQLLAPIAAMLEASPLP
jgi:iron uptake system component EfeO